VQPFTRIVKTTIPLGIRFRFIVDLRALVSTLDAHFACESFLLTMTSLLVLFLVLLLSPFSCSGFGFGFIQKTTYTSPSSSSSSTRLLAGFGSAKSVPGADSVKVLASSEACPCKSGKSYGECCEPFHKQKEVPQTPPQVVRSRFSALVLKDIDYIIATTHPKHKEYVTSERESKLKSWQRALKDYSAEYQFVDLIFDDEARDSVKTLSSLKENEDATCSFVAKMQRAAYMDRPLEDMVETSTFSVLKGKFLYRDAVVKSPFKNIKPEIKPQGRAVTTIRKGVPNGNQG